MKAKIDNLEKEQLIEMIKVLCKFGADINGDHGAALIAACNAGDVEMVNFLLHKKANVHMQDDMALIIACHEGHVEIVNLLIKNTLNYIKKQINN